MGTKELQLYVSPSWVLTTEGRIVGKSSNELSWPKDGVVLEHHHGDNGDAGHPRLLQASWDSGTLELENLA